MSEKFDDIARIIGSELPRRQVLRLISSALAGATLAALRLGSVEAAPRTRRCGEQFIVSSTGTEPLDNCATQPNSVRLAAATRACENGLQNNRNRAAMECPPSCPSLELPSRPGSGFGCNPASARCCDSDQARCIQSLTEFVCSCPTPREICNNGLECCPPGQICCGRKECCLAANCMNQRCNPSPARPSRSSLLR
jgi:hypothetical protein